MIAFTAYISVVEPKNIKKVFEYIDWIVSMQEEHNQLEKSKAWHQVPSPKTKTVIGTMDVLE